MPIRKKSEDVQPERENIQSETKHCPYCDNEIKAKAVKCQYCWEFLDWRQKETTTKKTNKKSSNGSELVPIKAWKAVYRWYIWMFVWVWIAILAWISDADFLESDGFNILDIIISFIPIILLMIWSNKTYGYLLNTNTKNLRFDSTWWPTRWWICPIACLYIPYQAVKDIYKTFNEKCWIIWWWWACYLISSILLRLSDTDDTWFVALLALGVVVAEYVLIMKIVKNINRSLED